MKYIVSGLLLILIIVSVYLWYINYVSNGTQLVFNNASISQDRSGPVFQGMNNNNSNNIIEPGNQIIKAGETVNLQGMKLMTYNIKHGVGLDGELNLERIINTIKSAEAQIIGLNEVDSRMVRTDFQNQAEIMAGQLQMNYAFGPALKIFTGSYGNAILTSFPIINVQNYLLPNKLGLEPRALLEVEVLLPDNKSLLVLSTHLSINKEERGRQLTWLEDHLKKVDRPFILMGDFNSEVEKLEKYSPLNLDDKTYPADKPAKRIDMFFTNLALREKSYTIPSTGSDHLPVVIDIKSSAA